MPPATNAQTQSARPILTPGDRVKRDEEGRLSAFGNFRVHSTRDSIAEASGVTIGIYGAGGTGKTTFLASICDRNLNPDGHDLPMVILDSMAGVKSVSHLVGEGLQQITIHSFSDIEDFVSVARAQPRDLFPWRSVLLDNLTYYMNNALEEQGFHNVSREGGFKTSSQPDFNAMTTRVSVALRDLKDLSVDCGFNLFISIWDKIERTAEGTVIGIKADLTPKLSTHVQGILDYIGYMSVLPNQVAYKQKPIWLRKLDFSPNPMQDTKWRVTPDHADEIPSELYLRPDGPGLTAVLNTIKRGVTFPRAQFTRP